MLLARIDETTTSFQLIDVLVRAGRIVERKKREGKEGEKKGKGKGTNRNRYRNESNSPAERAASSVKQIHLPSVCHVFDGR